MKETITFNELMKELEKHRGFAPRHRTFTDQQIKFLQKCREERPVPYKIMADLWIKAGWDDITEGTIRTYYMTLRDNGFKNKDQGK